MAEHSEREIHVAELSIALVTAVKTRDRAVINVALDAIKPSDELEVLSCVAGMAAATLVALERFGLRRADGLLRDVALEYQQGRAHGG